MNYIPSDSLALSSPNLNPLISSQKSNPQNNSLEQNPAAVYVARLARNSQPTMKRCLQALASLASGGQQDWLTLPWHSLRYQHTAALRAQISEQYAPATVNKMLCALRGVLQEAWRLGLINAEDCQRAKDVKAIKAEVLPAGRALSKIELRSLVEGCIADSGNRGRRDAAMIAVMYATGVRRSEVVSIKIQDFNQTTGTIAIRSGKGKKDRLVYIKHGAAAALSDWIKTRGKHDGWLFLSISKSGRILERKLTAQAVLYILKRRAHEASIQTCSPHDLRRTFIGDLLSAGADISTVQKLAGHSSIHTTARYDRRGENAKITAAELLFLPYSSNKNR